ncbi:MAG: aminotransferase class I/II-fold pyridoxal phosphate-dependent enzyme [Deltaproteobacteria bacterium]|nr:aminotransferase class I/II-fold pyridoxal phosphate-dependent enzyme [Deltaproteobacteria bacterium]
MNGQGGSTRRVYVAWFWEDLDRDDGAGIPAGAIIPVVIGAEREALRASEVLKANGVLARAIRPPSVPPGTCRIRLTACAGHSPADLEIVAAALSQLA